MPKILIFPVLFFTALISLIYFLHIKNINSNYKDLTSIYKVKLKRKNSNNFESVKDGFFYKVANILLAWLFFITYLLNNAVTAKDDKYVNRYSDDNYFKYNVTLYSSKDTGLPADCPPKIALNQVYSKNRQLAVVDCPCTPTPHDINTPPVTPTATGDGGGECWIPPGGGGTITPDGGGTIIPGPSPTVIHTRCGGPTGGPSPSITPVTHAITPPQCGGGGSAWNNWGQVGWGRWMPWQDTGNYQHWSDAIGYNDMYGGSGTPCPGGTAPPPWNQGIQANPNPQMCGLCGTPAGSSGNPSMCGQGGTPIGGPGSGGNPSMCSQGGTPR